MRKLLNILIFIILCPQVFAQTNQIKLEGYLKSGTQGEKLVLSSFPKEKGEKPEAVCYAVSGSNGEFVFDCKGLKADKYQISKENAKLNLFLDYCTTKIVVADVFSKSKVTNSPSDSIIRLFDNNGSTSALLQLGIALTNKKYMDKGEQMPDSLLKPMVKMMDSLGKKKEEICNLALKNGGLALAYIVSANTIDKFNVRDLNSAYSKLNRYERESYYGNSFGLLLEKVNKLEVGVNAPDFISKTPEGKEIHLSEFIKGKKLVLIDFWASWCGPCRKENPNVRALYKEAKNKGFDILSVSLDNKYDNWVKAINEDNLTWTHVSDLGGWKEKTAVLYNITAVPATILLDENGMIIAKNLRGDNLKQKVLEICK